MGLSLLANLSAFDFGYIQAGQLIKRTANALQTMARLERHRGHFYNWYDTLSLQPLAPLYISSVDSGNLAAHLLTLRAGLLSLPDLPILGPRLFDGVSDTLGALEDSATELTPAAHAAFVRLQRDAKLACDSRPVTLDAAHAWLGRLAASAAALDTQLAPESHPHAAGITDGDTRWWAQALVRQCVAARDDLVLLAPWLDLTPLPEDSINLLKINNNPTLRELCACTPTAHRRCRERRQPKQRLTLPCSATGCNKPSPLPASAPRSASQPSTTGAPGRRAGGHGI